MRKLILLIAGILPAIFLPAQDQPSGDGGNAPLTTSTLAGLLRTQLTITPAWSVTGSSGNTSGSISGGRTNVYLHGTAEYYFTERFSARGDGYYFVNKNKTPGGMKHNHCVQVGADFHLLKSMSIDPYVGLATGLNLAQVYPMDFYRGPGDTIANYAVPAHLDPVWGPRAGVNFYGQRIFHFFIEAQYLMGAYHPPMGPSLSLNEIRVSAGLGWNWVFTHKEATVRQSI